MNQFATPRIFQAKPSTLKKKIALIVFVAGAISLTLAATGVIATWNAAPFFAGGITAMALAFRFWNMQVRGGAAIMTFNEAGITLAKGSSSETISWADLESIRYRVWRGGQFWEFKGRGRKSTLDYYVDGLASAQLNELRETISSIQLPSVRVELVHNPLSFVDAPA